MRLFEDHVMELLAVMAQYTDAVSHGYWVSALHAVRAPGSSQRRGGSLVDRCSKPWLQVQVTAHLQALRSSNWCRAPAAHWLGAGACTCCLTRLRPVPHHVSRGLPEQSKLFMQRPFRSEAPLLLDIFSDIFKGADAGQLAAACPPKPRVSAQENAAPEAGRAGQRQPVRPRPRGGGTGGSCTGAEVRGEQVRQQLHCWGWWQGATVSR